MKTRLVGLVAVLAVLLALPAGAHAVTCADYPNQAAAQRAADTRDADGDGIYCEALPCPCLKPGQGTSNSPSRARSARPRVGRPRALARRTKSTGCRLRGALPDPGCTPGSIYPKATRSMICVPGYARSVRNVPQSVKERVYRAYGITSHHPGQYEIDHLVPLAAGGSNSIANLFPQRATPRPSFREKDRLEVAVHDRVCEGRLALRPAQRRIARDWVALYRDLHL